MQGGKKASDDGQNEQQGGKLSGWGAYKEVMHAVNHCGVHVLLMCATRVVALSTPKLLLPLMRGKVEQTAFHRR